MDIVKSERSGTVKLVGIPAVMMRGGTSKGVFIFDSDLPPHGPERDRVLLDMMGTPDPMQIDGLGGTYSSTSKVMVISQGDVSGTDVQYSFAQIGIDEPVVDWSGNCGNLTVAVGPFAVDAGLLSATEPVTTVRMFNRNTGVTVVAQVEVRDGISKAEGDLSVPGVPGTGAPVSTTYIDPAGGVLGAALPTGASREVIECSDRKCAVTVMDVTHPTAFARASDFGLNLSRTAAGDLNRDADLLSKLEELRGRCAVRIGAAAQWHEARFCSPIVPRLVLVAEPTGASSDIAAIGISLGKVHRALQMTATMCLAAAALLEGTVPHEVCSGSPASAVRVSHPQGVVRATADVDHGRSDPSVRSVGVVSTARRLFSGTAWVRGAR